MLYLSILVLSVDFLSGKECVPLVTRIRFKQACAGTRVCHFLCFGNNSKVIKSNFFFFILKTFLSKQTITLYGIIDELSCKCHVFLPIGTSTIWKTQVSLAKEFALAVQFVNERATHAELGKSNVPTTMSVCN